MGKLMGFCKFVHWYVQCTRQKILTRYYTMQKLFVKDQIYGALLELTKNRTFFYRSSIGHEYCHWTDQGKQELMAWLDKATRDMLEAEEQELNARARDMVFNQLKKKHD